MNFNNVKAEPKTKTTITCTDPPPWECVVIRGDGINRIILGKGKIIVELQMETTLGPVPPGYLFATNYFFNMYNQNSITTGKGFINGEVHYPASLVGDIYTLETDGCTIYTDYNEWLNAVTE